MNPLMDEPGSPSERVASDALGCAVDARGELTAASDPCTAAPPDQSLQDAPGVSIRSRRALMAGAAVIGLGGGVAWWLRRAWLPSPQDIDVHVEPRAMPALHVADAEGNLRLLDAWRGRTVLLNVWATWCAPCREEMPTLDRLQATLGSPSFEVVALSIDSGGLHVVQTFFQQLGLRHLRAYLDTEHDAARLLAAGGIPLTLLIDAQGREVARKRGAARWDDPQVQALIAEYLPAMRDATSRKESS